MEATMRNPILTGAVAIIVTASGVVAGQKAIHPPPAGIVTALTERARIRLAVNPTAVLDRILSFDANADNRISREELPERMQGLLTRGDRNQDGVLTPDEIAPLGDVHTSLSRRTASVDVHGSGNLATVIADLKLPPATHNRALAIVNKPRSGDDPAHVDVTTEMKDLLNDEDYENYVAAAARLQNTPRVFSGNIGGRIRTPPAP
jgi:hypothetical protein